MTFTKFFPVSLHFWWVKTFLPGTPNLWSLHRFLKLFRSFMGSGCFYLLIFIEICPHQLAIFTFSDNCCCLAVFVHIITSFTILCQAVSKFLNIPIMHILIKICVAINVGNLKQKFQTNLALIFYITTKNFKNN